MRRGAVGRSYAARPSAIAHLLVELCESVATRLWSHGFSRHCVRYLRMRGPRRRVTANGKRCHTFERRTAPLLAPGIGWLRRGVTGIVYQKSGSSRAPHWRLKRYVPEWRLDRPKSKRRKPSAHAVRRISPYRSILGHNERKSFRHEAQGTARRALK